MTLSKNINWHHKNVEHVLSELSTTRKGLSSNEADKRLKEHGYNDLGKFEKVSAWRVFLRQFKSFIIYVLLFAAAVSFFIGDHTEFSVISGIILFVVILSFIEEYTASKDMDALKKLTPIMARVLRDGQAKTIHSRELAPGDVILLKSGDRVPADARLISANSLKIDESMLTGESKSVLKNTDSLSGKVSLADMKNMVFSSTLVVGGGCEAIVVGTGRSTEVGKISGMLNSIVDIETPLQKRMDKFGKQIAVGVFALCALIFVLGIWRGEPIAGLLLICVAMCVAGIPESLPTIIAVTLAVGVKNMAKQNAIIRRLPAVETLGATTVICTDKTGTLTQNKMVIENIWTMDTEVNVTGVGFNPKGLFLREGVKINPNRHNTISKLLEIGVMCNNANLLKKKKDWLIDGEAREGAFIVLAKKAGIEKIEFHKKHPRIHEHPFDPVRRCMTTIHHVKDIPIVYTKGAPSSVLEKSDFYLDGGKIKKMTRNEKELILKKSDFYASKGLHVMALAYKEHKGETMELFRVEKGLIFAGLASMRDPPEPSAKESIINCKEAGIRVVMLTGDNRETAKAIAEDLDIYKVGDRVVEGVELDEMDDTALKKIINEISVFARVTPKHKLRIVECLQDLGHVVAMTGDGVNDAPALKKADIGVAMGRCGTEVAKEASEMVLKDDNFTTIVNAIKEGRNVYLNIQKTVYYLLATNFSEVILILVAVLLGAHAPLTALMILFINLVGDELPALSLAFQRPSKSIMKQKPRDIKEGILSDYLLLKLVEPVPLMVLGTLLLYIWTIATTGSFVKAQTVAFATIIMFEIFHTLNARSWQETALSKKVLLDPLPLLGMASSFIATLIVIYAPFFQGVFGTVSLALTEWIIIIVAASSILFYREIEKSVLNAEIQERTKSSIYPTREV
ncbi:MAG: HAD-IC family P-type ATPase [archaeon]